MLPPEELAKLTPEEIERIKEMPEKPFEGRKVLILTPAYKGELSSHFTASERQASQVLTQYGAEVIPIDRRNVANHVRLRNTLITDAMMKGATDLIFIDSDVGFHPDELVKLMAYEYIGGQPIEVVGACPPLNIPIGGKPFAYKELPGKLRINSVGLAEVAGIPTAFMRITRSAIERMMDTYTTHWNDREGRTVFQFFKAEAGDEWAWELHSRIKTRLTTMGQHIEKLDPALSSELGNILWDVQSMEQYLPPFGNGFWSEDYWFCERFRRAGGRIYLATDIKLVHFKSVSLTGSVREYLEKEFDIRREALPDDDDGVPGRPDLGEDLSDGVELAQRAHPIIQGPRSEGTQPDEGQVVPQQAGGSAQSRLRQSPFHGFRHSGQGQVGRAAEPGGLVQLPGGGVAQPGDSDGDSVGAPESHPSGGGAEE